jgi:hypothetical protein
MRTVSYALLVFALTVAAFAEEYTGFLVNRKKNADAASYGVTLTKYPSGDVVKIHGDKLHSMTVSPDGKRIAVVKQDNLYVMFNDGSEERLVLENGGFGTNNNPMWNTTGVFYFGPSHLYRVNPETGERTPLLTLADLGKGCTGDFTGGAGPLLGSIDGLRAWSYANWDPPERDDIYCGCRGYDRGGHPYIQFSPDFSRYDVVWDSEWGHGRGMLPDGNLILVALGTHRNLSISKQYGDSVHFEYRPYGFNPPYPEGYESRPVGICVNNADLVGTKAGWHGSGGTDPNSHLWFYNWRDSTLLGEFKGLSNTETYEMPWFWEGPLPDPHDNRPYIRLDKSQLIFVAPESGSAPPPQMITVTNLSKTALVTVTAAVSPASATWLKTTLEGSGDSQTVKVEIVPANLSVDQAEATISVSGGGAANTAECVVQVYKGATLPPPTELKAGLAGDSLNRVALSWKDNSAAEEGFIIERKTGGTWSQLTRTQADITAFTDSQVTLGGNYFYRVKAYKPFAAGEQVSAASNEAGVTVSGIPWVRIISPMAGQYIKADSTYTVIWTENLVDQVKVEVSTDDGLSWTTVTAQGGILKGTDHWGKYPWKAPAKEGAIMVKVADYNDLAFGVSGTLHIVKQLPSLAVSKLTIASGNTCEWDTLAVGKNQYADRAYTFTEVPASYAGMLYLKTANDDRALTQDTLVSFDINMPATVYVAHTDNAKTKPSWMSGFVDTGDDLKMSANISYSIYYKQFPAGTVTLGPNGGAAGMYTVMAVPLGSSPIAVTGNWSPLRKAAFAPAVIEKSGKILIAAISDPGGVSVRLINASGRIVRTAAGAGHMLALQKPAPGLYLMRIHSGGQNFFHKLMIER